MKYVDGFGAKEFGRINAKITGHICMYEDEAELLAKSIYMAGDGDHLEIGSMWGGSAILAALVKKHYKLSGQVMCIEPFRDADCSPGFPGGHATQEIFFKNMKIMGVKNLVSLYYGYSCPFPFGKCKFASAFVDGDHSGDWPLIDWQNVSQVASTVIYHDLYPHEPGVMQAVNAIRSNPGWEEIARAGSLAAWRKK